MRAFGFALDPIANEIGFFHRGVDITAQPGTPVRATGDGVVIFSELAESGCVVVIGHGYRTETYYSNLSRSFAKVGHRVHTGDNNAPGPKPKPAPVPPLLAPSLDHGVSKS